MEINNPQKSTKRDILFWICLILGVIISLLLIFECYRYLVDFMPEWYEDSDISIVKWGIFVLILALAISVALMKLKKIRVLGIVLYGFLCIVSVVTLVGLESNITNTKRYYSNLKTIGERHMNEVIEENSRQAEELEQRDSIIDQLRNMLVIQKKQLGDIRAPKVPENVDVTSGEEDIPKIVMDYFLLMCQTFNETLYKGQYKDGILFEKSFFENNNIVLQWKVTSDIYKQLVNNTKWQKILEERLGDVLNGPPLTVMKIYQVGLVNRYINNRTGQKYEFRISPSEMEISQADRDRSDY